MSSATATKNPPEIAPASGSAAISPQIGTRARALREAMGLSLRDLAERCGVSAPMLSQIERGETSPTLAVAAKVAEGLELTLSQLLRLDESEHVVVIRAKERRRLRHTGHRVEELTPPLPGQRADVSLHSLDAGASTGGAGDPPIHEPGSRETAVVLAGAVTLVIDGESHQLRQGDSVTFDADLAHHFTNSSAEKPTTVHRGRLGRPAEELSRMPEAKTMFDKIWQAHEVSDGLIYIDLHLVHEVTSPQAFDGLRLEKRPVRRPEKTIATADHNVPTDGTPAPA